MHLDGYFSTKVKKCLNPRAKQSIKNYIVDYISGLRGVLINVKGRSL